jgi:flagellar basal-body rod protein FlgB
MQAPLFALLSKQSAWLGQRQAVLSRNIANADTPGFAPRDLVPFSASVRAAVARAEPPELRLTHASHREAASRQRASDAAARPAQSYETAPSGNAVVLEEEVQKLAATRLDHELALDLYGKYTKLVRTAIGLGAG